MRFALSLMVFVFVFLISYVQVQPPPCRSVATTFSDICSKPLLESPRKSKDLSLEQMQRLGMRSPFYLVTSYFERISPVQNGEAQMAEVQEYPLLQTLGGHRVLVSRSFRQKGFIVSGGSSPPNSGLLEKNMERALNFVFDNYRSRRPHWTPEFLAKLRKLAKAWLQDSTYIIVEQPNGTPDRPILGTIRFIRERDGHLPMEHYLGVQINVGNDFKVEPGNFAISKDRNEEAWLEIASQLLNPALRSGSADRPHRYLTYADQFSEALYKRLGFKPVPMERIHPTNDDVKFEGGRILANGIWWLPMEASQDQLDYVFTRQTQRGQNLSDHGAATQLAQMRANDLQDGINPYERIQYGWGSLNGQPARYAISLTSENDQWLIRLSVNPPNEWRTILAIPKKNKILPTGGTLKTNDFSGRGEIELSFTSNLEFFTALKLTQSFGDGSRDQILVEF